MARFSGAEEEDIANVESPFAGEVRAEEATLAQNPGNAKIVLAMHEVKESLSKVEQTRDTTQTAGKSKYGLENGKGNSGRCSKPPRKAGTPKKGNLSGTPKKVTPTKVSY